MKNKILFLLIMVTIFCSCTHGQETKQSNPTNIENELYKKLDGEWEVVHSWTDKVLIFNNKKDKNFKQVIFPTINTIIFNQTNKTIDLNTYGEFGCGSAAQDNLKIKNSKWSFENDLLHLRFEYRDYSGDHTINNSYMVNRNGQILTLTKVE